jgi:hypothetical protein
MMAQSHGSTDWRVQFGAPQVSTPAAPAAPVAVTHSHSNGTHFGTLDPRAAPAQRSAPVTAIPLRGSAAPLPVSSSAPNSASLSAPSGGPIAATPATPARPTDDALGDAQAPVDEERASEPHHARALRWARRFVTRD